MSWIFDRLQTFFFEGWVRGRFHLWLSHPHPHFLYDQININKSFEMVLLIYEFIRYVYLTSYNWKHNLSMELIKYRITKMNLVVFQEDNLMSTCLKRSNRWKLNLVMSTLTKLFISKSSFIDFSNRFCVFKKFIDVRIGQCIRPVTR
jgi:hypothetical protein